MIQLRKLTATNEELRQTRRCNHTDTESERNIGREKQKEGAAGAFKRLKCTAMQSHEKLACSGPACFM